jgi:hypothetical protein
VKHRSVRAGNGFVLAHLLLRFWDRFDNDKRVAEETMVLVKCDSAREARGIPSFLG